MALHSEEARLKAMETKKNNLPQISNPEERETIINILHYEEKVLVYTNNATVMNRLKRRGVDFIKEDTWDGEIYSRSYELSFKDMTKVFATGIYK